MHYVVRQCRHFKLCRPGIRQHSHGFFAQKLLSCSFAFRNIKLLYILYIIIVVSWSRGKHSYLWNIDWEFEPSKGRIFFPIFSFSKRCGKITFIGPTGLKMHSTWCGYYKALISDKNGTCSLISVFSDNCAYRHLPTFLAF